MESKVPASLQLTLQPAYTGQPSGHPSYLEQDSQALGSLPKESLQQKRQCLVNHIDDLCDCVDQELAEM